MMPDPYPLTFLDVETTGFSPEKHEIIEVGAVRLDGPGCETRLAVRVRPEHIETASAKALEVNGYSERGWAEAVSLREGLTRLCWLVEGSRCIGGHGLDFDLRFLYAALGDQFFPFVERVDTMNLARDLKRSSFLSSASLDAVCAYLGIHRPTPHRAIDDAVASLLVWRRLGEES